MPIGTETLTLAGSALMYMLAYFSTVPELRFCYIYWPAIAITAAGLMMSAGQFAARRESRAAGIHSTAEADREPSGQISADAA